MTILVTGASGHVGSRILDALLAEGVDVRASSRDAGKLHVPDYVRRVNIDLERPETLEGALDGVVSAFVYARPQGAEGFVRAAEAAGVRHVVLLSSAATRDPDFATSRITAIHRAAEDALAAASFAVTTLHPGAFATNTLGWAADIAEGVVRQAYPDSRVGAIHQHDVAAVASRVLLDGSHAGESLVLSGPAPISFREQAETLADVLGRPLAVEELTPDQARERLQYFGLVPEVGDEIIRAWHKTTREPAPVTDVVRQVTGTEPRTYRQWAEDHRDCFS